MNDSKLIKDTLDHVKNMNRFTKSAIDGNTANLNTMGRSYYIFCLEQALVNVRQARALVSGDVTEHNHELPRLEQLLVEAIDAS